ncbi:Methionine--tRNA ligase, mitochondrial [Hypsibius exemplaris]|uniref:Methionine--tRNA ligase, mitochondrial n=1 Tax=Hypsibius exemplaris TaxID=2072580 RepID=A0A1W0XEP9_HYPEX|nr:Methionine--tRNA ligase, mitochondrial [Hypsibius exemplaris]
MSSAARFFITTPIFYVNAAPHVGHLYTVLIADALHRWKKMKQNETQSLFSVGTDEHGLKIQRAAANADPKTLCDQNSLKFRQLFHVAGIEYTDFIRTTDARHAVAVEHAWNILKQKKLIVKGSYSGWYCTSDEAFLPESQVQSVKEADGSDVKVSTESGHRVEWMQEDNYLFRLGAFQDDLKHWIRQEPIAPANFNQLVEHWLEERELADVSVSRSSNRLQWGIAVPDDPSQRIYVWMDALINYLTVCGYPDESFRKFWPADVQIVGKDILKFHAIYWPAFLMGLGLDPPRKILCHSHWIVDHRKMSKSIGNVVDPFDRVKRYTTDGLRYFLLREGVPHSDSNYSDEKVVAYLNAELANTMGNLLNRCTALTVNPSQTVPARSSASDIARSLGGEGSTLIENLTALPRIVDEHYESFNFYKGIEAVMSVLREANTLVQNTTPWTLANSKDSLDKEKLRHVLFLALETLRVSGVLLSPVTPTLSSILLGKLRRILAFLLLLHYSIVAGCEEWMGKRSAAHLKTFTGRAIMKVERCNFLIWNIFFCCLVAVNGQMYGKKAIKGTDKMIVTDRNVFRKAASLDKLSGACDADESCVFSWACDRIRKPVRSCSGPFYFFTVCCKTANSTTYFETKPDYSLPPTATTITQPHSTALPTTSTTSIVPIPNSALAIPNQTTLGGQTAVKPACGRAPLMSRVGRIVGGSAAQFGEFPFQAMVVIKGAEKCGGALLDHDWVVTAGHCVASASITAGDFIVKLGVWDRTRTNDILPVEERLVTKVILHPTYSSMRSFSQDIALLRLSAPVVYAPHIQPICLPAPDEEFTYLMTTITGWGRLQFREDRPSVLQKVDVPVISNWQCESMFTTQHTPESILPDMMCASTADGTKDACQGDSGGPLSLIRAGSHVLVGLVSWGYGCALPGYPGVYARMSKFTGWLEDTMRANI